MHREESGRDPANFSSPQIGQERGGAQSEDGPINPRVPFHKYGERGQQAALYHLLIGERNPSQQAIDRGQQDKEHYRQPANRKQKRPKRGFCLAAAFLSRDRRKRFLFFFLRHG
jgi:hypothetical protein